MSTFDQNPYQSPMSGPAPAEPGEGVRPELWNPNAAANWSLLLTPAFGACLHAANWRALGNAQRAKNNMVWVWTTVGFLAVNFATVFLPDSATIDSAMRWGGIGLLLAWYFNEGRPQAKYVKEVLHDDYAKRGWGKPLAIGFAAVILYIAAVFVAVLVAYMLDPDLLDAATGNASHTAI